MPDSFWLYGDTWRDRAIACIRQFRRWFDKAWPTDEQVFSDARARRKRLGLKHWHERVLLKPWK